MQDKDRTILIVDDEKISLRITNHILQTKYRTICVSSGKEAFEYCLKERPDIVLSDLRMPGMSGFELQAAVKKAFREPIPFMFMTADSDEETESQGFAAGAQDFIRKPFRADVLLRRVHNILETTDKIRHFKRASETDRLTGLLNKASAEAKISELCAEVSGALLMIDLDSFKLVNDIFGHAAGDTILIHFADICREAVRSSDIVGRLGGDEFIAFCQSIFTEDVVAKKAAFINEKIVAVAKELFGDDMAIPLGASVGAVFVPEEGRDFHSLYQKADKALYNVKHHGKHGSFVFHSEHAKNTNEKTANTDLSNLKKILGERTVSKGAMHLPLEQFKTIYQFVNRVSLNYSHHSYLALFTVHSQNNDSVIAFFDTVKSVLRQSDVITSSAKNQCLVLLLEMSSENIGIVTERVKREWQKNPVSQSAEISVEISAL